MRFAVVLTTVLMFMSNLSPQTLLFQDIWKGGVTACGANVGNGLSEYTYNLDCHIEQGSFIRKAYLMGGTRGDVFTLNVKLNDVDLVFDSSTVCTSGFISLPNQIGTSSIHYIDVTNVIGNSGSNNTLYVPEQDNITIQHFKTFYLVVLYENSSMPVVSSTLLLNSSDVDPVVTYNFSEINSVSNTNDVAFGFAGWAFCNTQFDGTFIEVNNINIGLVGGDEYNSPFYCSGTQGHFYYQQNELFALGDDVANEFVNESDAIANIQSYVENLATNVSIGFIQQSPNTVHANTNPIICAILAYTSPCQPFPSSLLTSDTTVCAGVPLQLGASGGTSTGSAPPYEWLPQQNLSCYDCPNPVFLGDSTINYTVRIRNTDSCSVVYPVRVRVLPKPNFESIEITESVCGGASGEILARPVSEVEPPHLFQLNGANTQLNEANYSNLAPGVYTITLTDGNACKRDSIVEIGEFNNVLADFYVNPSTGAAPLDVQISNQSQNATQYFWDFSDESGTPLYQGSGSLSGVEAPLAGIYTLTLIATNGFEHCADTASLTILVYDTLQLIVPNVFTPNSDGSNDWFGITANLDTDLQIVLLNRWGNVMLEKQITLSANTFTPLWDGANAPDGVYFYKILLTSENKEMSGFVEVRR